MTSSAELREVGGPASDFFYSQLALSEGEFSGVLAERLARVRLDDRTWVFAPENADVAHQPFSQGWGHRTASDAALERGVFRWFSNASQRQRYLVLEDPFASPNDSAAQAPARFCRDKVMWWAGAGDPIEHIRQAMRNTAGYPAVGVLAEVGVPLPDRVLGESDLEHLAAGVRAVLVRAFDDEAFLLKCVNGASAPQPAL